MADKQTADDNYMLTLAAIVKELEARGMTDSVNRARIHLAVGLPLKLSLIHISGGGKEASWN